MKGTRVYHEEYGKGTIVTSRDEWTNKNGERRTTGRVGVVFDNHIFMAHPAFFWLEELDELEEGTHT